MPGETSASVRDDRAAIDKALSLLEGLHEAGPDGSGVSALARRSQLSKSTAFRVLSLLEKSGAVDKVGTNYQIGARIHRIARAEAQARADQLRDTLTPFLVDLHASTGATVHLSVLRGNQVLYLNKIHGHTSAPTRARIGHLAPAHCTSAGKVLLSYETDLLETLLREPLLKRTPRTITDPDLLRRALDDVRRTGFATDLGEALPGLACTAVSVGGGASPRAAISVAGGDAAGLRRHTEALRRVALAANQQLARDAARRRAPQSGMSSTSVLMAMTSGDSAT